MPVGAIKMYTSSSPLLQMGHFLMDKNCVFVVLLADIVGRKIIFTTVISVWKGVGGKQRLETETQLADVYLKRGLKITFLQIGNIPRACKFSKKICDLLSVEYC